MKVLITGANGFVGKHLSVYLKELGHTVYDYDLGLGNLEEFTKDCEFVFHFAGVNRPKDNDFSANYTSLEEVLRLLDGCPVMLASSIQAELDNDYGRSKLKAENILKGYKGKHYIYRFPNIFGPGCRPNYNSVVATWCYDLVNNIEPKINDPYRILELVYVYDLVRVLGKLLDGVEEELPTYKISLPELLYALNKIKNDTLNSVMPLNEPDTLQQKLRATYVYYYNKVNEMIMHKDDRGSFTELYKSNCGQVSINKIKPGITKGNHYHHNKFEMFTVVSGNCEIVEKNIFTGNIKKYLVSGEEIVNIYMSPGWTHSIKNIGATDAIVVIYANEVFDKEHPDTFMYNIMEV